MVAPHKGLRIAASHSGLAPVSAPGKRRLHAIISATGLHKDIRLPKPEKDGDLVVRNYLGMQNRFPKIGAGHRD
jgi:hypothetical protein